MGASVGTGGGKGNVNVELNIVPFIDLMSCLTAFLLATAVWVNIEQIMISPKGKNRDITQVQQDEEKVTLSVALDHETIWVALSRVGVIDSFKNKPDGSRDWDGFLAKLKEHKQSAFFGVDRRDIEIAADSQKGAPVAYQDLMTAMDKAIIAGFPDVGLTDMQGLAAPPHL
jgi:biopolymer transport protein ExbD